MTKEATNFMADIVKKSFIMTFFNQYIYLFIFKFLMTIDIKKKVEATLLNAHEIKRGRRMEKITKSKKNLAAVKLVLDNLKLFDYLNL